MTKNSERHSVTDTEIGSVRSVHAMLVLLPQLLLLYYFNIMGNKQNRMKRGLRKYYKQKGIKMNTIKSKSFSFTNREETLTTNKNSLEVGIDYSLLATYLPLLIIEGEVEQKK
ncbi:hypothetical protein K1T71_005391 [Dendrolimus kikuchii]|uniref:Uncharacterized protein n=1 Tax=Dendrolimus kikuchii TaxID=765133 RepID=A0ACC1D437_9NEOP|nr:hypothetical protein K1T71_005391 [Dendrolimus kikuchii]